MDHDESYYTEGLAKEEKEEEPQRPSVFKTKKFWITFAVILVILLVVGVPVILYVAFPKIAQSSIDGSQIKINTVNITNPTATNFSLTIDGTLSNAGPIGATIAFDTLDVSWRAPNGTLIKLGIVNLPSVAVSGGAGTLHSSSVFAIEDVAAFTEFTDYMLSAQTFIWNMHGTATVTALGRSIPNLKVDKDVVLNGLDNFPGVTIEQFSLPQNDPQGGITMVILTKIPNLSPMAIQLGTVVFAVSYKDTTIGQVQAEKAFLEPGNNYISLNGRMVVQTNPKDLDNLSDLMSAFVSGQTVNTTVSGVSAAPDGVNQVSWLSVGLQSVKLVVPLNNGALLKTPVTSSPHKIKKRDDVAIPPEPLAPAPLNLITGIVIGDFDLAFNSGDPYVPLASSDDVQASYQLPFGFDTNITAVAQNMTISTDDGVLIANIISTKFGSATTNQSAGILTFAILNSPLVVIPGQEALFQEFTKNLTIGTVQTFKVIGNATVDAQIPIGPVVLSGVSFAASVNLTGLGGLTNPGPVINSVDVIGGTTDGILLSIDVDMVNPSKLQISAGDVYFELSYESEQVGTVLLPNLTLYRGEQVKKTVATFASAQGVGQDLLNNFAAGQSSLTGIQGFNGTTNITSLQTALPALSLTSQIPGLNSKLIISASVTILPSTIKSKIAQAFVVIKNPFTSGFDVTAIDSTVTTDLGVIGSINVQLDGNPFTVGGHSNGKSNGLPFTMNLDPSFVAKLVRSQAKANGLDTRPLDALLALGGMSISDGNTKRSLEKRGIFDGFNISSFVIAAFKNFVVSVDLKSTIQFGDYSTPLVYHQDNVPALTDDSVTLLIPIVGQPIVQMIVTKSNLAFSTIVITNVTDKGFTTHIVGAINETGPIDAMISFPGGIDLYWNGKKLGNIAMGSVNSKANVGAGIDMDATFTVSDANSLEAFSEVLLLEDTFTWTLQTSSVSVTALGFTFTDIQLEKDVTLHGFSGFAPFSDGKALIIDPKSFSLFDTSADDEIGVKATANLRTRANIGLRANVVFEDFFASNDVDLGSLTGTDVFILPNPAGSESIISTLSFEGSLVRQTSPQGVATIAQLFAQYLKGVETVLYVKGVSASGSQGNVGWLSKALAKVRIDDVVLPGIAAGFQIIQSVKLDNAEFDFITGSDYAPIISSTSITSGFKLPFDISMDIIQVKQNLIVEANVPGTGNVPVATILADYVNSTTKKTGPATGEINFGISKDLKVPLSVFPAAKPVFDLFTIALTTNPSITFAVAGSVDTHVATKIASFAITNLTVGVQTELAGLNNLDGTAVVKSLSVDGGDSNGIIIHLTTSITNPSPVTIDVGDVTFDTLFTVGGATAKVGNTVISGLSLKSGTNDYLATFTFNPAQDPTSQAVGSALLSGFLSGGKADLLIKGTVNSTSILSLKGAFSTVHLTASVQGVPPTLITQSDTYTSLFGMASAKGESTVLLNNVFNTSIVLSSTNNASVTYIAKYYPDCLSAGKTGDWLASEFGAKSKHPDTPGPPSFTVGPSSSNTSAQFGIDFEVTGLTDTRPLIYGLMCPNLTSIDGDPKVSGNGTINNRGKVDVSLSATVLIGGSKGYQANIMYSQLGVTINNHFTAPYAAYGLVKTIYCIMTTLTNPPCCACATAGIKCPAPGVCPPLSDGTPVPPPSNSTSSIPTGSIPTGSSSIPTSSIPTGSISASVITSSFRANRASSKISTKKVAPTSTA